MRFKCLFKHNYRKWVDEEDKASFLCGDPDHKLYHMRQMYKYVPQIRFCRHCGKIQHRVDPEPRRVESKTDDR